MRPARVLILISPDQSCLAFVAGDSGQTRLNPAIGDEETLENALKHRDTTSGWQRTWPILGMVGCGYGRDRLLNAAPTSPMAELSRRTPCHHNRQF